MITVFKRRFASRQAVSHSAEGIEPRELQPGKDDVFNGAEVSMGTDVGRGKEVLASPGSETMACLT